MWQVSMGNVASAPEKVQLWGGTQFFINCISFEQPQAARDHHSEWCRNRAATYRSPSLFVSLFAGWYQDTIPKYRIILYSIRDSSCMAHAHAEKPLETWVFLLVNFTVLIYVCIQTKWQQSCPHRGHGGQRLTLASRRIDHTS